MRGLADGVACLISGILRRGFHLFYGVGGVFLFFLPPSCDRVSGFGYGGGAGCGVDF